MRLLTILCLAVSVADPAHAKPRLREVSALRAEYNSADETVDVTWQGSPGAKRYEVEVASGAEGEVVSTKARAGKTNAARKSFPAENFMEGAAYTVSVRALGGGSYSPSVEVRKKFKFSRKVPTKEIYRRLSAVNSGGRHGMYFLPKNYRLKSFPIMLLLHGSSVDGNAVARIFRKYAREKEFIIVAPDSVHEWGWEIAVDGGPPTEDQLYIEESLAEVLALPLLRIDSDRFLVAGISAGAEVSAYIGSNDAKYTSFAVLHGGVDLPSLGSNLVPVWLSTGTVDLLRPPEELLGYKPELERRGFGPVLYSEYDAAHAIPEDEREALVDWWLP